MTAPDFLPVLAAGAHTNPKAGACVMEYVSLLAGEPWSDSPACTHPVLAAVAREVNDRLPDGERQQLVPLIGRLFGTATDDPKVSVRLAVWSARHVLHLVQDRAVCQTAVDTTEAWCDGRATRQECRAAATAAYGAAAAYAASAAAAYAAAAAANAADADAYGAAAAYAASAASAAANAADADARVGFLTGLLDEYDRLTGRTATPLTTEQYASLAGAVR